MTVRMVPSPPQYAGPQRPARPQYDSNQIRDYVIGNGWADQAGNISNPQAIYGAAQRYGVSADQLDRAGNWTPGTAANFIQQQGWNPLSGTRAPQTAGAPPNPYLPDGGNAPNFEAAYQQSQQQIANGTSYGGQPSNAIAPQGQSLNEQLANRSAGAGTAAMGGAGYTAGPAGSSGGLTAGSSPNPYPVGYVGPNGQQMNPAPNAPAGGQMPAGWMQQYQNSMGEPGQSFNTGASSGGPTGGWQYGYGNAPGQSNRGYYEQQTPVGSFAASEGPFRFGQQFAQPFGASNPYLGAQTSGINGQGSVLPYAQQLAQFGQRANPYLGAQTQQVGSAGTNPLIGRNPYLEGSVNDALKLSSDNFQSTVLPQFDSMARRSGSFGNTGVEAARGRAIDNFGRNQSAMATNAFMQDYGNSQQLQEAGLNRQQAVNMANAGFNAGDLARNLGGAFTGQQLGMQGISSLLGAGQFDASLGNNVNQFNASLYDAGLGRNQNLAQGLSLFNAGAMNNASQFNAGQGNALGQAFAQMQQQNNQFNAGSANSMLGQVRNLNEQGRQFDDNLNWNIDRDNWQRMRTGSQDEIDLVERMMRMGQTGVGNANYLQGLPLEQLTQFVNLGRTLGGSGGQNVENYSSNPYLAAISAYLASGKLFGG